MDSILFKSGPTSTPIDSYNLIGSDGVVTAVLAGGLGNMMFQIAAGYSLAKKIGREFLLYTDTLEGMAHRHPLEYSTTVFKSLESIHSVGNVDIVNEGEYVCISPVNIPAYPPDEETQPNKFDIKGTGAITDLVDNVFIVWRNKKKENNRWSR